MIKPMIQIDLIQVIGEPVYLVGNSLGGYLHYILPHASYHHLVKGATINNIA